MQSNLAIAHGRAFSLASGGVFGHETLPVTGTPAACIPTRTGEVIDKCFFEANTPQTVIFTGRFGRITADSLRPTYSSIPPVFSTLYDINDEFSTLSVCFIHIHQ